MSATLEAPTDPVEAGEDGGASGEGRGPRWLLLLAVGLALVGLLASLAWWALPSLVVSHGVATIAFEAGAPASSVDGFGLAEGESSMVVGYEHDQYARGTVTVPYAGLVGAEVVSVRLATDDLPLLVQVEDGVASPVSRGQDHVAEITVRFDNCEYYHEREASLIHEVVVTSRVFGRDVVERVPLETPVFARSPMLWQCPDRTIDRQANNRTDR